MRIAVMWEMGGGLGHIDRLAPVIAALLKAEHAVTLVARDPARASRRLGAIARHPQFRLVPGPVHLDAGALAGRTAAPTESVADVLTAQGLDDASALSSLITAWSGLLASLAPDLVISDFSPFGNLVARRLAPVIVVGSGFSVPPPGRCRPLMGEELSERALRKEERFVVTVNEVARSFGLAPLQHVTDLFRGNFEFVLTFPILDPYRRWRKSPVLTPYTMPRPTQRVPFRDRPPRSAFIYLPRSHRQLEAVLETVRGESLDADAYLSDVGRLPTTTSLHLVRRHETPVDLSILLRVQFVIHTGGLGLAHAGLAAGAAQILLPLNLEQELTALTLAELGLAAVYRSPTSLGTEALRQAVRDCLGTPSAWQRIDGAAAACPDNGADSLAVILRAVDYSLSMRNSVCFLPAGSSPRSPTPSAKQDERGDRQGPQPSASPATRSCGLQKTLEDCCRTG
jgi:UDP:flavonoid glycosyltransferase YjiC (YdhE family)